MFCSREYQLTSRLNQQNEKPTSKKICHKIGHFSSLCYKKREKYENHKISFGSPKAHQLKTGLMHTQNTLSSQSEEYSSEEDSFCLQPQVQSTQAETNCIAPQHLITNLEHKLKPHKKRTKVLRARTETYANVNLMPICVYKLLYKDDDCQKLAPSNKSKVKTYCTEMIQIGGSCNLYYTQTQSVYKKSHSKWPAMKAVLLFHVQPVLS